MLDGKRRVAVAVGTVVATYACFCVLRFTLHALVDTLLAVAAVGAVAWALRLRHVARRDGWAVALRTRGGLRRT